MSLFNELQKLNRKTINEHSPAPVEAIILRAGAVDTYDIKFRNGGIAYFVAGPSGLSAGDSVSVLVYPGKQKRYVVTGKSYRNISSITVVEV